jgi:hypothetical protein
MAAIDCTDCYLAIAIGDGVKRALVRHFAAFLSGQLAARGITPRTDAALDKIDRDAWRLAARVVKEVEAEIDSAFDETLLAPDPQKIVQDLLAAAVEIAIGEAERRYLDDDILGFSGLLEKFASGELGAAPHAP